MKAVFGTPEQLAKHYSEMVGYFEQMESEAKAATDTFERTLRETHGKGACTHLYHSRYLSNLACAYVCLTLYFTVLPLSRYC